MENSQYEPSVIDLFCGAGGLSAGLESAGWQTVVAVDFEQDCIKTLAATQALQLPIGNGGDRTYLEGARLLCQDISKVTGSELRPAGKTSKWRPDLIAGGPPCQPFSSAGRMLGMDDPRGKLFLEFVRLTSELRPRFVLFENVAGLVTAKCPKGKPGGVLHLVQQSFEEIGYACRFSLINAADYGAPQRRTRLFMIGSLDEKLPEITPSTHAKITSGNLFERKKHWHTLGEFLATQASPDPEDVVRPPKSRLRELSRLEPGTGIKATGIVEANRPGGHWGYRQDCFLADQTFPSRTIRAASTPDWIKLADGSLRRLTWRECAGLQGFPVDWAFVGTNASKFRQIGNAVQGDVARAIGAILLEAARTKRRERPTSAEWPEHFHRRVRYTASEHAVNGAHRAAAKQAKGL